MTFILLACANKHAHIPKRAKKKTQSRVFCVKPIKRLPPGPWDPGLQKWLLWKQIHSTSGRVRTYWLTCLQIESGVNRVSSPLFWVPFYKSIQIRNYKGKHNIPYTIYFTRIWCFFFFIQSYKSGDSWINLLLNLSLAKTIDSKHLVASHLHSLFSF